MADNKTSDVPIHDVPIRNLVLTVAPPGLLRLDKARDLYMASLKLTKSEQTIKWYGGKQQPDGTWHGGMLQALLDHFGQGTEVASITIDDLEIWRSAISEKTKIVPSPKDPQKKKARPETKISIWTVDACVRAAKTFFSFLARRKKIPFNPASELERVKLPKRIKKGISDKAAGDMLAAARLLPDELQQVRAVAVLRLLEVSGIRLASLQDLRVGDIDFKARRITVRAKGDEEYIAFFRPKAEAALRAWLALRPAQPGVDHVFTSLRLGTQRGNPLGSAGLADILEDVKILAGVKEPASAHRYRHRVLRLLVQNDMPTSLVADIANHKDERVTRDFYGRLAVSDLNENYNRHIYELPDPD